MQSRSHRLIKERTGAELIMLPREAAKTVRKLKSLVLFLFLGATVALAAIHVENDPYRKHHHHPMLVSLNIVCSISFCHQNVVAIALQKILLVHFLGRNIPSYQTD